MALDEDNHRLFVITRRPPLLIVLDCRLPAKRCARVLMKPDRATTCISMRSASGFTSSAAGGIYQRDPTERPGPLALSRQYPDHRGRAHRRFLWHEFVCRRARRRIGTRANMELWSAGVECKNAGPPGHDALSTSRKEAHSMATPTRPMPAGQDPAIVDSGHYKVELENESVRVLRIKYGPGEKSVMHGHPASVTMFLNGTDFRFIPPTAKSRTEQSQLAGDVLRRAGAPAGTPG